VATGVTAAYAATTTTKLRATVATNADQRMIRVITALQRTLTPQVLRRPNWLRSVLPRRFADAIAQRSAIRGLTRSREGSGRRAAARASFAAGAILVVDARFDAGADQSSHNGRATPAAAGPSRRQGRRSLNSRIIGANVANQAGQSNALVGSVRPERPSIDSV
jgi:hypothetical protein